MAEQVNYQNKVGDEVRIVFLDSKMLIGKLIGIYRYEFIVEAKVKKDDEEHTEVVVFKHAIKYMY